MTKSSKNFESPLVFKAVILKAAATFPPIFAAVSCFFIIAVNKLRSWVTLSEVDCPLVVNFAKAAETSTRLIPSCFAKGNTAPRLVDRSDILVFPSLTV